MLGLLRHQTGLGALISQILEGMGAVDLGQSPGVVELAVSDVVEGSGLRRPSVEPIGRLIDIPQMALNRIGLGN